MIHKNGMNKRVWIPVLCVLLCVAGVLIFIRTDREEVFQKTEQEVSTVPVSGVPLVLPAREKEVQDPAPEKKDGRPEEPAEESEPAVPYVSPVDFAALREKNPDIVAWLYIEGSDISYPVVQNADDSFYLDHDEDRKENPEGAIFSESAYNGTSFEDDITVLYGHHMKSGRMFGNLQALYSDPKQRDALGDIVLYAPDKELRFRVFAAVPYSSNHILYCYGNKGERGVLGFLYSLSSVKSLDAYINEQEFASPGDKLLVLSTCLRGDRTKRFLVAAKQIQPE